MSSILGTIGGIVGLIVFFGAAVVYLRGSKDKGTIETLERSNKALAESERILETKVEKLTVRVAYLEKQNADLQGQRPSAEAIEAIRTLAEKNDREIKALIRKHDAEVKELLRGR